MGDMWLVRQVGESQHTSAVGSSKCMQQGTGSSLRLLSVCHVAAERRCTHMQCSFLPGERPYSEGHVQQAGARGQNSLSRRRRSAHSRLPACQPLAPVSAQVPACWIRQKDRCRCCRSISKAEAAAFLSATPISAGSAATRPSGCCATTDMGPVRLANRCLADSASSLFREAFTHSRTAAAHRHAQLSLTSLQAWP